MSAEPESIEVVDAVPVVASTEAQAHALARVPRGAAAVVLSPETRRSAVLVLSGLVVGALTSAARGSRRPAPRRGRRRLFARRERAPKVLASRSFMIDVHLLDRR